MPSLKSLAGFILLGLAPIATVSAAPPTFYRDVTPIVWKQCAVCHRPDEVGPFSLLSYDDVAKRAEQLVEVTASGRMPPWPPAVEGGPFVDERRLSEAERETLRAWAEAGAPRGDEADRPPLPEFPSGWQLGPPDLVLEMEEAFDLPADGPDRFRCFVLPLNHSEDRHVAAIEFQPGNRRIAHHAIFYLDPEREGRRLDEAAVGPGYECFGGPRVKRSGNLGGWVPGMRPYRLPAGYGMHVPRGADLILQMHYHPSGKPEQDRSRVAIYFTRGPVERLVRVGFVGQLKPGGPIPAGEKDFTLSFRRPLPIDTEIVGILPHMHWIGQTMRCDAQLPDGTLRPLIAIPNWDFNWQSFYYYPQPVLLPRGSELILSAKYDNSSANPRNPSSPPRDVRFGEQTTDEMFLCGLLYVERRGSVEPPRRTAGTQSLREIGLWLRDAFRPAPASKP